MGTKITDLPSLSSVLGTELIPLVDQSGTPTTKQALLSVLLSSVNLSSVLGTLSIGHGGTGQTAKTAAFDALSPLSGVGDILYGGTSGTGTRLVGQTAASIKVLTQTGTGSASAAPIWTIPTGSMVGLANVENTTLSTWAGTTNLTTLGVITTGSWGATNIPLNKGGTGQTTKAPAFDALSPLSALGDLLYGGTAGTGTRLAGNTTATQKFLAQTGDGTNSAAPSWAAVPTFDTTAAWTMTGVWIYSKAGAASTPPVSLTGAWFTSGGTATTTKPQVLIEPAGTATTAWSTAGTGIGVNAATGFAGNLMDLQLAGVSKFSVNNNGRPLLSNNVYYSATNPDGVTVRQLIACDTNGLVSIDFNSAGAKFGGYIQMSSGSDLIMGSGYIRTGGAATLNLQGYVSSVALGNPHLTLFNNVQQTNTSGAINGLSVPPSFQPTSGTATYTAVNIAPTVNQTGGASGITRAIYINPTLTAAADFRALEVSSGKTILNGVVMVGSTSAPLSALDVNGGVAVGTYAGANASPSNGMIVSGSVGIGTATLSKKFQVKVAVGAADGIVVHTGVVSGSGLSDSTLSMSPSWDDSLGRIVFQNSNGSRINSENNDGSASAKLCLQTAAGRLLVGTATDDGANKLQVSGSAKASGKMLTTGGIGVGNSASATVAVGTLAKKIEVFDDSGNSLGFIAVYSSIT